MKSREKKFIVFGSSMSTGLGTVRGGWVDKLSRQVNRLVLDETNDYWGLVYNLGISGDTSTGICERFEREARNRYSENQEVFVIVEIGINDSMRDNVGGKFQVSETKFAENIDLLINKASFADHIIFLGPPPVVDHKLDPIPWMSETSYKSAYCETYNTILKRKCMERDVLLVDIYSEFVQGGVDNLISTDGVHPNDRGHEIIFKEVSGTLKSMKALE